MFFFFFSKMCDTTAETHNSSDPCFPKPHRECKGSSGLRLFTGASCCSRWSRHIDTSLCFCTLPLHSLVISTQKHCLSAELVLNFILAVIFNLDNSLAASSEAFERQRAHSTQHRTTCLLSGRAAAALQLLTLLSSLWIREEITRESCCGLSRRPIVRRSDSLLILIELWQLIWRAVILDSIPLNGRSSD